MQKITKENSVYAIYEKIKNTKKNATWYSLDSDFIQVQKMNYDRGKIFRKHAHKIYDRISYRTQECFVLIKGKFKAEIFDEYGVYIDKFILSSPGDVLICLKGYHKFEILDDDTVLFEIKNGPYLGVEKDKEFME